MSVQRPPPQLYQGASDPDTDSDYLGTPVDPPASCQPCVAEYEPVVEYSQRPFEDYDSPEYVAGHAGTSYMYNGDSRYHETPSQYGLLLQSTSCSQSDNSIPAYQYMSSAHTDTYQAEDHNSSYAAAGGVPCGMAHSSLSLPRGLSDVPLHCTPRSLQCPEHDNISPDNNQLVLKAKLHQPDLTCDTSVSDSLTDMRSSYHCPSPPTYAGHAANLTRGYFEEGYVDSPIEETYCDRFPDQGAFSYEQPMGYDHLTHPGPHSEARFSPGSLPNHSNIQLYQPPSCPYSYPRFGPIEGSGYGSSPVSASSIGYAYPDIHAPRPQAVHGIHGLRTRTCSMDDSPRMPSHHVLSIPSIPIPPPMQRPSSLVEDSPKKPLTLACFFCRKRKIACQSPPASSHDRTCNQCAKRKLKCVYPSTSRRGIRPRVYDAIDEPYRRAPLPLSH